MSDTSSRDSLLAELDALATIRVFNRDTFQRARKAMQAAADLLRSPTTANIIPPMPDDIAAIYHGDIDGDSEY